MAGSGEYSERHFEDLNSSLIQAWNAAKLITEDPNISEELYGRRLYGHCIGNQSITILGLRLPPFFISGSLHYLANAPLSSIVIGWHKSFKKKLEELIGGGG